MGFRVLGFRVEPHGSKGPNNKVLGSRIVIM